MSRKRKTFTSKNLRSGKLRPTTKSLSSIIIKAITKTFIVFHSSSLDFGEKEVRGLTFPDVENQDLYKKIGSYVPRSGGETKTPCQIYNNKEFSDIF